MHASNFAFLAIVIFVALAILFLLAPRSELVEDLLLRFRPLRAKEKLLSEFEHALYQALVAILPNHIILARVQLLQVLNFGGGYQIHTISNRISRLSLDFLILNSDTSIVAAIGLNHGAATLENSSEDKALKYHALRSAGIPLIVWPENGIPDKAAILEAVARATPGAH